MTSTLYTTTFTGKTIVFIFNNLELGGAERQGLLLAQHLHKECKAEVKIIGLKGKPGRLAELCVESGIPCHSLHLGRMRTRWEWLRGLFRFVWLMRRERPGLLIAYTKNVNILSGLAWRIIGARHCIWNQADEGLGMGREFINRVAVALTPCFVSNSAGGRTFLQERFNIPDSKVTVIHNGISLALPAATRQEWRERLGIAKNTFVAIMVANITEFKDHTTLINAWQIMLNSCSVLPAPILLLAGRFDGPEKKLIKLIHNLNIESYVKFVGAVDDVSGLLAATDLFIYSSRSEGLPNAVIEAMAAGRPIVGTDIPGIREAVGQIGIPFLAPVGDAGLLAEKIQLFIGNQEICTDYGRVLKERAEKEFNMTTMLENSKKIISKSLRHR